MSKRRPETPEEWEALLPREPPPDTGPKKLRPGQVYAHGIGDMGCMIGEVGQPEVGPARWDNGQLVKPEGYAFKRLAGDYSDALTFVTDECFVTRFFVLLFDATPATVKREPVAPWVRFEEAGKHPVYGAPWVCTAQSGGPGSLCGSLAAYDGPGASCEACAERAGVFGPVKDSDGPLAGRAVAQPNAGLPDNQSVTAGETAICDPCCVLVPFHGGKCCIVSRSKVRLKMPPTWMLADDLLRSFPPTPTCSGPLSTHGTPVLRVMGWREIRHEWMCDGCYLDHERKVAAMANYRDGTWSMPTEPPARVGTVPMSIGPGAGIGIWASRGMRER